jgi:hypothetical protein
MNEVRHDRASNDAEHRLLDFVASLIIDMARTHPRVTEVQVALWLARVAVGVKK